MISSGFVNSSLAHVELNIISLQVFVVFTQYHGCRTAKEKRYALSVCVCVSVRMYFCEITQNRITARVTKIYLQQYMTI